MIRSRRKGELFRIHALERLIFHDFALERDFAARELILEGPFDLITCMLGRLSHFGWDRPQTAMTPFDDLLQRILDRMAALLSEDGMLFLGTWSSSARRNRNMLKIYTDIDQRRLAEWTPDSSELRERLGQAGLQIIEQFEPETRLDLYVCQRKSPPTDGPTINGAGLMKVPEPDLTGGSSTDDGRRRSWRRAQTLISGR